MAALWRPHPAGMRQLLENSVLWGVLFRYSYVDWAHKEVLPAPKNIIFPIYNHCYRVMLLPRLFSCKKWPIFWRACSPSLWADSTYLHVYDQSLSYSLLYYPSFNWENSGVFWILVWLYGYSASIMIKARPCWINALCRSMQIYEYQITEIYPVLLICFEDTKYKIQK